MEIFKDIEGFEGLYQVSNLGKVKSLNYRHKKIEKILKPFKNNYGYLIVILWKDGKYKHFTVQRLVADAFIPNPENKPEVNHKNELKDDNRSENLEWCDSKYNINYGTRNERLSKKLTNRKDLSKRILCVETNTVYLSSMEAERQIGINHSNIIDCLKGKRKTAGKFHWKYANQV